MSQPPNVLTAADKQEIRDAIQRVSFEVKINKTLSHVASIVFAAVMFGIGWFGGKDYYQDKTDRELIRFGYGTYDEGGKFKWTHPNVPPAVKP